jgi:hypothetical protein
MIAAWRHVVDAARWHKWLDKQHRITSAIAVMSSQVWTINMSMPSVARSMACHNNRHNQWYHKYAPNDQPGVSHPIHKSSNHRKLYIECEQEENR